MMKPGQVHHTPSGTVAAPPAMAGSLASHARMMSQPGSPSSAGTSLTWDRRLYSGLHVACVPADIRASLAEALGNCGVEAEFYLFVMNAFPGQQPPSRPHGDAFLMRLEASAYRIHHAAAALEIATQSYLTALEIGYPHIGADSETADVWWPGAAYSGLAGESLEMRLRRCGFAYRHVVSTHLASNAEALAEQMTWMLHALNTLPPAGTMPASTLYQSLYELSSTLQGYVIPHHITGLDDRTPGILIGISTLRRLSTNEDTSLASDITWVRAQYDYAQSIAAAIPDPRQRGAASSHVHSSRESALAAAREWQQVAYTLQSLAPTSPAQMRTR